VDRRLKVCGALAATLVLASCGRKAPAPARRPEAPESTHVAAPVPPPPPKASYRAVKLKGEHELAQLENALGARKFDLFLKVNRVDLQHVRDCDTLAVPDSSLDSLALSPFPVRLASVGSVPKLLFVSLRVQAFAAYDSGQLVRWGPVSTGKKATPTPPGLYHANWKAKKRYSTVDDSWLLKWCVNIEVREGVSLHEYELPGRPASHSCVRLAADDAEWVYNWVDQWQLGDKHKILVNGTPVLVFGDYAWGAHAPWKRLEADPLAASVSVDEASDAWAKAGTPGPTTPEMPKPARARPDTSAVPADTVARDSISTPN
jgi:hypothetical protein